MENKGNRQIQAQQQSPELKRIISKLRQINTIISEIEAEKEVYSPEKLKNVYYESERLYDVLVSLRSDGTTFKEERELIDTHKGIISIIGQIQAQKDIEKVRFNFGVLPVIYAEHYKFTSIFQSVFQEAITFHQAESCLVSVTAEETKNGYSFLISAINFKDKATSNRYTQFIHLREGDFWLEK